MPEEVTIWQTIRNPLTRLAFGVPQAGIAVAPYVAQHLGNTAIIWPPLDSVSTYVVPAATVVIFLFTLIPESIDQKMAWRAFRWSLGGVIVSFAIYAFLVGRYVISVETPQDGLQTRSVGFIVEPRIRLKFPSENLPELLMIGGLEEWQIEKVWTPGSVQALRLSVLATYCLTLSLANVVLGAAAKAVKGRRRRRMSKN